MSYEEYKVNVPEGRSGKWEVNRFEIPKGALRNYGHRYPPPGAYTRLMWGETVVMSDTPAEIRDHYPLFHAAENAAELCHRTCAGGGSALIHGLGLGIALKGVLDAGLRYATVIEKSSDVIALVAPYYRELYLDRVRIIHADALTWQPPKGALYDVVWHDIWDNICAGNLPEMHRLHRRYGRRSRWQKSWCREECEYLNLSEKQG